jgi:hypothetical protein
VIKSIANLRKGRSKMTMTDTDTTDIEQWREIRRKAAAYIDPKTAEVWWEYGEVSDPYGIYPALPIEDICVGRNYFARSPGSDIWVWFGDLPEKVRDKLWNMHSSKLAFPAGLEPILEYLRGAGDSSK